MLVPQRKLDSSSTGSGQRIVTSFLTEMDGIFQKQSNEIVFLIAVTSNREVIDPAIMRPGRIDIHLKVDLPNLNSRVAFLTQSLRRIPNSIPLDDDLMIDLAVKSEGFSSADLGAILKKASIIAIREKHQELEQRHVFEAINHHI